jgi:hypothetical protein
MDNSGSILRFFRENPRGTTGNIGFMINSSSTVYIPGYSTNGTLSTVSGTGQISVSSDIRLKSNITDVPSGALDIVKQLIPREFTWNSDPTSSTTRGFIAQEVEKVLPVAVDGKKYEY